MPESALGPQGRANTQRSGRLRARRGVWSLAAAGAAVTMLAAGCSTATTSSSASSPTLSGSAVGGTLTIADSSPPISMNPALDGNGRLGTFIQPAYDPLITIESNGTLKPDLAASWSYIGSGNKEFSLTLRKGVKFSNGSPMTAQDVVNSINYYRKNGVFSEDLNTVTSVTATGPYTVQIKLSAPNPELPYAFDQYWQLGDVIAPAGLANPKTLLTTTLGAGPYVLDSAATIANNTYTYTPNPYYWDKSAIHWQKIVIKVFTDTNSALQALESGQLQLMIGTAPLAATLTGNSSVQVLSSNVQWDGLILTDRTGKVVPALANVKVRQAINYAINRSAVNKVLNGNYGTPSAQIQGPGFVGYQASLNNYYPYDPTLAKKLLAEAGYPNGFSMTLLEQGTTQTNLMAEAITGQLAQVGIKATIKDDATFGQYLTDMQSKKYPAFVQELNMASPYLTYLEDFYPTSVWNIFGASNQQMSSTESKAVVAPASASAPLWDQVYATAVKQAWFAPVGFSPVIYFATKTISAPVPGEECDIDPVQVLPAS